MKYVLPLLLAFGALVAPTATAQDPLNPFGSFSNDPVLVRTEWSMDGARPGDELVLAVVIDIEDGWHINPDKARLSQDFLLPTVVKVVEQDANLQAQGAIFPEPHLVEFAGVQVLSYEHETVIYLPVKVRDSAEPGSKPRITLEVDYQACNDTTCNEPQTVSLSDRLPIVDAAATPQAQHAELFAAYAQQAEKAEQQAGVVEFNVFGLNFEIDTGASFGVLLLLLAAAFGGFLLNFTPCVLPVIPIKIIGLSQVAGNRSRCLALGASMSVGVVAFWIGLGVLISAASGFTATNQLFQYPAFTISIGVLIIALAIGMCGLFSVRLPNFVYSFTPKQETLAGSFGLGIMTAILSTPCTAPFMGTAAAWAAGQTMAVTLGTFTAIGVGMALPYLILSAAPGMVQKMPRSGPASELIKQVMGLFLLAAGAYFVGSGLSGLLTTPPAPPSKLHWWPVMGLCAIAGLWLAYRTFALTRSAGRRVAFAVLGVLVAVASMTGATSLTAGGPVKWIYYTEDRFAEALEDGKTVLMDFTAEWCLNCKALEHAVLYSDDVVDLLESDNVVAIKVDITGNNEAGTAMLNRAGSLTIPYLAIYAPSGDQVFRSEAYTRTEVIEAIQSAAGQQVAGGAPGDH